MTLVVMTTKRHFQTVERLPITEEKDCSPKTGISGLGQFTWFQKAKQTFCRGRGFRKNNENNITKWTPPSQWANAISYRTKSMKSKCRIQTELVQACAARRIRRTKRVVGNWITRATDDWECAKLPIIAPGKDHREEKLYVSPHLGSILSVFDVLWPKIVLCISGIDGMQMTM